MHNKKTSYYSNFSKAKTATYIVIFQKQKQIYSDFSNAKTAV